MIRFSGIGSAPSRPSSRGTGGGRGDFNERFIFGAQCSLVPICTVGVWAMESNQRFYLRRAAEERTAARRAMTPEAQDWHSKLALDFAQRAIMATAAIGVPASMGPAAAHA